MKGQNLTTSETVGIVMPAVCAGGNAVIFDRSLGHEVPHTTVTRQ